MEECDICLTKLKKQYKNKHEQSKKQKCFSNLFLNRYIVRNPEIDNFKDIIQSYCNDHKKKFDNFTLGIMRKKNDWIINRISVPSVIKIRKPFFFEPSMIQLPLMLKKSAYDYLDQFNKE